MPADPTARDRLLDAADVLIHQRGYEAVGVAELCQSADVRKGSFYHFFPSKQALAIEMLDRAWARTERTLFVELNDPTIPALDAIEAYGNRLADRQASIVSPDGEPVVAGCRFGNLGVELSTTDGDIRSSVGDVLDAMTDAIAASIRRSVDAGNLRTDLDVDGAAADIVAHMEGLMVMAKVRRDPAPLRGLGATARRLLA